MAGDKEDKKKKKEKENGEGMDTGFTVKDKRKIGKEEEAGATPDAPDTAKPEDAEKPEEPKEKEDVSSFDEKAAMEDQELPPIDFMSFIMSLSTSALIYMGEIPDPVDNEKKMIIPMAKQMIDLISLLKEKTKGNLTADEEKYMENILFELKMLFVKTTQK